MKKKAFLNIGCSLAAQFVTIISGLVIPRLLLMSFGSEANGLVSSITQFLNYIALVEGGIGSVVLSSLYGPLASDNNVKVSRVLKASNKFFHQIAWIFAVYAIILGCVYPFLVKTDYSWIFIVSLTLILAVGSFVQYCFSITYKLLLQADQKMYIVQIVQIGISLANLLAVYIAIRLYPELHVVKIASALLFIAQPIIYSTYVKRHYHIDKDADPDETALSQRWSCFGQNFAYFIHSNTDVVVLTFFTNLKLVSVYNVYFLIIGHIQSLFKSFSHAFSPMIGKAIAINDENASNHYLDLYEIVISFISTIVFGCTIYLLPDFIMLYTHGVADVNYFRPLFSTIIILAEYIYCIRDPYVAVIYAAGKFKETAYSAYLEAGINIVLSVILVKEYGLEGIAVGTLIGMAYRMFYMVWYISKNIIYRPVIKAFKRMAISCISIILSLFIMHLVDTTGSDSVVLWIKNGFLCVVVFGLITTLVNYCFDRQLFLVLLESIKRRRKA